MSSLDAWTLTIPWEPWSKKRPAISKAIPGKRPRTHQPTDDRDAEKRTREFLEENWHHPIVATNVGLTIVFYRASRHVVDTDNLIKHLQDAGSGVLFVNDAQVTAYGDVELQVDRDNPRTVFELWHHETTMLRDFSSKLPA